NTILFHKSRNDCMQWSFSRSQCVWMVELQCEKSTAIMQDEACAGCDNSRTEVAIVALNQRDDVAVLVDRAQVNRVLSPGVRVTFQAGRFYIAGCLIHIDELRTLRAVSLGEKRIHGELRELRITDITNEIGIREFLGFNHDVKCFRAVEA